MKDPSQTGLHRPGWRRLAKIRGGTKSDRRNFLVLIGWMVVWVATFLPATWALQQGLEISVPAKWLLASIPTAVALVAFLAYLRFLRMANELFRRTQLDALALGCGAGILFGVGYQLFEHVGAPAMHANHMIIVMTSGWIAGLFIGMKRYW